jgi:hypothetical protein
MDWILNKYRAWRQACNVRSVRESMLLREEVCPACDAIESPYQICDKCLEKYT